jgi:hypothetical protein
MSAEREPVSEFAPMTGMPALFESEDEAEVYASYIDVDHPDTEDLLYDPFAYLRTNGVEVSAEDGWTLTITRANAGFAVPKPPVPPAPRGGPHHHLAVWLVLRQKRMVLLVTFRKEPAGK